tara:strand:- start:127 stop:312 length:186 start_codon:yes stop_codon:yes gene_type:complete
MCYILKNSQKACSIEWRFPVLVFVLLLVLLLVVVFVVFFVIIFVPFRRGFGLCGKSEKVKK